MVSGEVEPVASEDAGVHEKCGCAGVFAGLAAGGLAGKTLRQFMLRIPSEAPQSYDEALYQARYQVENCFGRLKDWRGVATRYAKKAATYLAICQIRALALWAKVI